MAEKTINEQIKYLKKVGNWLLASEIGCVIAPFIVLSIVNFDEYFVQNDSWRMTASFSMIAGATIIAVCLISKEKLKLNLGSALTGLVVADVICFLLGSLITELAYILFWVIIGFVVAMLINIKRANGVEELKLLQSGVIEAKKDIAKEQATEAIKNGAIKFRIKK